MKTISRYIMTLALLLTAATGAWAQDPKVYDSGEVELSSLQVGDILLPGVTLKDNNNSAGANIISNRYSKDGVISQFSNSISSIPFSIGENGLINVKLAGDGPYNCMPITKDGKAGNAWEVTNVVAQSDYKTILIGGTTYADPSIPDVTTNAASEQDLFTEASFTMPAFDATAEYELVRDMQDEANPVAFSGLPTTGNIVVKKGDDGKYQPAEALTIQLIDPLAAAEAQNIIAADGITVKVLVGDGGTPIEYDQDNPITLEAFLADMKPGYYWIKAEATDENSPYDGTVYSSQFTVVEKYDLTVKPANDFSKGKIESVTVGSGSVTIDANTGEATKTGIAPDTEVKIKAKRGYVIEKVEVKKHVPMINVGGLELIGEEGQAWSTIVANNPDKIEITETWLRRKDNGLFLKPNDNSYVDPNTDSYNSSNSYTWYH